MRWAWEISVNNTDKSTVMQLMFWFKKMATNTILIKLEYIEDGL